MRGCPSTSVRFRALRCVVAMASAACGCSLLVDASDIDAGCPEGYKECPEGCVRDDDPRYGCASVSCNEPCLFLNAEPTCVDGECAIGRCFWGFGRASDGRCEAPVLSDPSHCGARNVRCPSGWHCYLGECRESLPDD
jgi:hypothetical protein